MAPGDAGPRGGVLGKTRPEVKGREYGRDLRYDVCAVATDVSLDGSLAWVANGANQGGLVAS
jgi:hypothetical protein